jgi:hypothetical protein
MRSGIFVTELFSVDDSRSMKREEGGKRIETLKRTLRSVAGVFSLARSEGINAVRFLNVGVGNTNVVPRTTNKIIDDHTFRHWTRIGTELKGKVLDKHVFGSIPMQKPLLVITITDGDVRHQACLLLIWLLTILRLKASQGICWFPLLTIVLRI